MIKLAFSPCPNDTFIFYAMVHGKVDTEGFDFDSTMEDVECLNQKAFRAEPDMCKVSYHAYLYLTSRYALLDCGSALGYGNGPLLIGSRGYSLPEIDTLKIAVPGEYTTAHLLFRLAFPKAVKKQFMIFSGIEDAILSGETDAGIIIHENRFTFEKKGLSKIMDLGSYWENLTHCPIPLGGIVARKSLGEDRIRALERILHRSILYAMAHPEETMAFVRRNAREMDEEVMRKHISLFVNDFSLSLGKAGRNAVSQLFEMAKKTGIIEFANEGFTIDD